jgi:hypothetical protein
MANVNLTIDDITRESLRVLHQNLNFTGNIVRDYDDSFAQSGAKIGNTLRVRLPLQYSSATGATMNTTTGADSVQTSTTLTVNTQRHVPMRFTSNELSMSIDDFSERHIKPAMAKLAAMIEYDGLAYCMKYVGQSINAGTKVEFADIMDGRAKLMNSLAPTDNRYALLDPQANVDLVVDNKSLFNDQTQIGKQYKEGMMGRFGGFEFYENTLLPTITSAVGGDVAYDVKGANQGKTLSATDPDPVSQTLLVDQGTKAIAAGDVFTIAGVNAVHPETKASLGYLKQFTVVSGGTGDDSITIAPAIIVSGPQQNVSAAPADNAALTFLGSATTFKQSLLFQKGFACMGSADLVLPKGVHMASRQSYDGISMRIVQDYDVVKDRVLTRLDVLYGFKVLRPDLACKIWHT